MNQKPSSYPYPKTATPANPDTQSSDMPPLNSTLLPSSQPIPGRGLATVEQKPYAQLVAALGSYFPLLHSMLRACYLEETFLLQAAQRWAAYR